MFDDNQYHISNILTPVKEDENNITDELEEMKGRKTKSRSVIIKSF
jgi:hypothetical protein